MAATATTVDPLRDPRCLVTTDAVVIDGANGVCHEARAGAGAAHRGSSFFAASAGLLALVFLGAALTRARRGPSRNLAPGLAVVFALVCALPGFHAVFFVRADAPASWPSRAHALQERIETVVSFSERHHNCVWTDLRACPACDPVMRYAVPVPPAHCARIARINFAADGLAGACVRTDPDTLTCGGAPSVGPRIPRSLALALAPRAPSAPRARPRR